LKDELRAKDHRFVTETDTEIVAHLIEEHLRTGSDLKQPCARPSNSCAEFLHFQFCLPMIRTRSFRRARGPPVVIGLGEGGFRGLDIPAILEHTRDMFFLSDARCP
jgi:glucosamine--fructose-6-phosphate aminotransferase (isomerizing)